MVEIVTSRNEFCSGSTSRFYAPTVQKMYASIQDEIFHETFDYPCWSIILSFYSSCSPRPAALPGAAAEQGG